MFTRYSIKINEDTGAITVVEDRDDSMFSCWHITGNNAEIIRALLKGERVNESFNDESCSICREDFCEISDKD